MDLSVVIPIHNEQENIPLLYAELVETLEKTSLDFELLFVDDGSTDSSGKILEELTHSDRRVRLVPLRRNFGQTAAMQAGFESAEGNILVTIDGDLQNDPADIPAMLAKLDQGFDLVHGWRRVRQDTFLTRRLPSLLANRLISRTTGFPIHDLGCTLKVIRREITDELELYGEMHRFIPILAHARGARCVEVETNHRPRRFGKTKYGLSRTLRVVLDLMTVKYMLDYFDRPMKLFGKFGLGSWSLSLLCMTTVISMKLFASIDMTGNPLFMLAILAAGIGVQFFSLGLLGEVSARIYYDRQHRRPFAVRHHRPQAPIIRSRNAA